MATPFLINASEAAADILELMPVLIGTLVLVAVVYGVIITIFLYKKAPLWRLSAFLLSFLLAFLGFKLIVGPGHTGVMVIVYFIPLLFGIATELLMRIKQRTT